MAQPQCLMLCNCALVHSEAARARGHASSGPRREELQQNLEASCAMHAWVFASAHVSSQLRRRFWGQRLQCNLAVYLETSRSRLHTDSLVPIRAGYCRYRRASDGHWSSSDCRQGLLLCTLDHTMPSDAPEPLNPFLEDTAATPALCLYCLCDRWQLSFYLCNCPSHVGCSGPLRRADSVFSPVLAQRACAGPEPTARRPHFPNPHIAALPFICARHEAASGTALRDFRTLRNVYRTCRPRLLSVQYPLILASAVLVQASSSIQNCATSACIATDVSSLLFPWR